MKAKFLFFTIALILPQVSNAAILYRVDQTKMPARPAEYKTDSESYARDHRFYVGAMYNFSMWDGFRDENNLFVGGKNSSSYEAAIGYRPYDILRVEMNYIHADAKWTDFSLRGETAMVNAIFDARVDSLYRLFFNQKIVPYVGLGAGASWNKATDIEITRRVSPTFAGVAGVGFELGSWFTIDLGYRYLYMLTPQFDDVSGLDPVAHQFRAGARVNF